MALTDVSTLHEVVETLAPLERRAGSPAEREAAEWLAARLGRAGAAAQVEEVAFYTGYARQLMPLAAGPLAAGVAALGGRGRARAAAVVAGALATAAIVDDVSNGPRIWRRLTGTPQPTWNVVAHAGDEAADRTLVVMAHHDAAPTGHVFDQSGQRAFAHRFPRVVERMDTSFPLWWPVAGGPLLVAAGAALGRRGMTAAGTALCALGLASGADIARSPVVPGANDNLSACAVLVALAERLREQPVEGLRVLLVSCGAEEVLQGGIHPFAQEHLGPLDRSRTWVLNLDTVGSPELLLVEGEGPFKMEDYTDPGFRDLVADVALRAGRPLRRGVRSRASSDSVIPSRMGFPTAMLTSWEPETKTLSNYHLMTDTPERLDYATVGRAVDVAEGLARALAA